jgi:hypothetical protein
MYKLSFLLFLVGPLLSAAQQPGQKPVNIAQLTKGINYSDSLKAGRYAVLKTGASVNPGPANGSGTANTEKIVFVSIPLLQSNPTKKITLSPALLCKTDNPDFTACLEFGSGLHRLRLRENPEIVLKRTVGSAAESVISLNCRVRENKRYLLTLLVRDYDNSTTTERNYYIQKVCASFCPRIDFTIYGSRESTLSFVLDNTGNPSRTSDFQISSETPGEFSLLSFTIEEI